MQIPPTSSAGQMTGQAQSTRADGGAKASMAADFDTFLKMLTTQMQNQDPLNPMDSSEYAVQLATFSSVEQQVMTNDLLRQMGGDDAGKLAQHASWVGMEARTPGMVKFAGEPVDVHFDTPPGTEKAELVVKAGDGRELRRLDITGAQGSFPWEGKSRDGTTLPSAKYDLTLETTGPSGQVEIAPVSTYAQVTEVQAGQNGAMVVLEGGRTVAANEVTALRSQ